MAYVYKFKTTPVTNNIIYAKNALHKNVFNFNNYEKAITLGYIPFLAVSLSFQLMGKHRHHSATGRSK